MPGATIASLSFKYLTGHASRYAPGFGDGHRALLIAFKQRFGLGDEVLCGVILKFGAISCRSVTRAVNSVRSSACLAETPR